jgi:hypothetical protein
MKVHYWKSFQIFINGIWTDGDTDEVADDDGIQAGFLQKCFPKEANMHR